MNQPLSLSSWISSPVQGGLRSSAPVPYFRKEFQLNSPVVSASLTITALGLYEAEINGKRVGDHVFAPGWTEYHVRVPVQTYDVTALLQPGENALGALLGDGWYCGYAGWQPRQNYGEKPELLAELRVELSNGETVVVVTDSSWKQGFGPICAADLLMGEEYDAHLETPGWSLPGFDDSTWSPAIVGKTKSIVLDALPYPPVKRQEELAPISTKTLPRGVRIYDFGQNFTGRIRLEVEAPRNTTLVIRHAEVLNPDGTLYTENLRSAKATDSYTCKGGSPEVWEPRFTFHGFRYVEVAGLPTGTEAKLVGIVLHSATPPTGKFSCSNPLLNQLQHNIIWGQKSNFLEVPTDCPQRDERLGWTGDAQVFIRTAAFNMDVREFFHKWLRDARDSQRENGAIPPIIPVRKFMDLEDGGPAWADAMIICPWTVYLCYGDTEILRENYEAMTRFMRYMENHRTRNFIRSHPEVDAWGGFGDWLALDGSGKTEGATPKDLIGTAFYAYDAGLMAQIATLLGKAEDAARYTALREQVVAAFQRRFVTPDGLILGGTQTSYVLALHFDLLPEALRPAAAGELVRDIRKRGNHLATGFVGTPYVLHVLERFGYLHVAYELLEQESYPSWLFPVNNGATTIWERWDGWTTDKGFQDKGMNSFNHYAYGAVGDWMYSRVAGLDLDTNSPGYRVIRFSPKPGGSITWAKAELQTSHGTVMIDWRLEAETLEIALLVPEGCSGKFSAPTGFVFEGGDFAAGRHQLCLKRASESDHSPTD